MVFNQRESVTFAELLEITQISEEVQSGLFNLANMIYLGASAASNVVGSSEGKPRTVRSFALLLSASLKFDAM